MPAVSSLGGPYSTSQVDIGTLVPSTVDANQPTSSDTGSTNFPMDVTVDSGNANLKHGLSSGSVAGIVMLSLFISFLVIVIMLHRRTISKHKDQSQKWWFTMGRRFGLWDAQDNRVSDWFRSTNR
jgi:hypothetical protein